MSYIYLGVHKMIHHDKNTKTTGKFVVVLIFHFWANFIKWGFNIFSYLLFHHVNRMGRFCIECNISNIGLFLILCVYIVFCYLVTNNGKFRFQNTKATGINNLLFVFDKRMKMMIFCFVGALIITKLNKHLGKWDIFLSHVFLKQSLV